MPDSRIITLVDHASTYRDGGEAVVLEILESANDLSSTSFELAELGSEWAERYHLAKDRANIVRALDLPADARVLEVGAGCGAVTRYLAEQCARVDALEPVPSRAKALQARVRDLDNVTAYVGMIQDLPDDSVYDIVVVIGVLEYVGEGTRDLAPYRRFLSEIERRLTPGGQLILAIENRIGVKYLAGAPEDHSNRIFDSIEDYPEGSPARTFSRAQLEALIGSCGLTAKSLAAFPDYKLARVVLDPEQREVPPSILRNLPTFPSPDWLGSRPRLVDEGRLWSALVDAGAHRDFGNSLLVIARKPGSHTHPALWPSHRVATYFSTQDRAPWNSSITNVDVRTDGVTFRRTPFAPAPPTAPVGVRTQPADSSFIPGESLIELMARPETSDADRKQLLIRWRGVIDDLASRPDTEAAAFWDCLPHNAVVTPDGTIACFDNEWHFKSAEWTDLAPRCALNTGLLLARLSSPALWPHAATARDVVLHLGDLLELPSGWLEPAVSLEAEFHLGVRGHEHTKAGIEAIVDELDLQLDQPMSRMPLAPGRERNVDDVIVEKDAYIRCLRSEIAHKDARLAAVYQSASWRITKPLRGLRRLFRRH